jgi:hypothetical protein
MQKLQLLDLLVLGQELGPNGHILFLHHRPAGTLRLRSRQGGCQGGVLLANG